MANGLDAAYVPSTRNWDENPNFQPKPGVVSMTLIDLVVEEEQEKVTLLFKVNHEGAIEEFKIYMMNETQREQSMMAKKAVQILEGLVHASGSSLLDIQKLSGLLNRAKSLKNVKFDLICVPQWQTYDSASKTTTSYGLPKDAKPGNEYTVAVTEKVGKSNREVDKVTGKLNDEYVFQYETPQGKKSVYYQANFQPMPKGDALKGAFSA